MNVNRNIAAAIFALVASQLATANTQQEPQKIVYDVARLEPTFVKTVEQPISIESLQKIIVDARHNGNKIAIRGGGFSQGRQTSSNDAVIINMQKLKKITHLDIPNKEITVQTGATWYDIQRCLDPTGLSVKTMQSYNDFSVGGSLGVNVHGQDLEKPMLIEAVKQFRIVLPDGSIKTCSRKENQELFRAALGGYGLVGVIVEATLDLAENSVLEKKTKHMDTKDYPAYFFNEIKNNGGSELHSARLSMNPLPGCFLTNVFSITYSKTDKPHEQPTELKKYNKSWRDWGIFWLLKKLYTAKILRSPLEEHVFETNEAAVTRNNAMNSSAAGLCRHNESDVNVLQEYFVPTNRFDDFVQLLEDLFKKYGANVLDKNTGKKLLFGDHGATLLNASIRFVKKEQEPMLSYAPKKDSFAFVLFINHKRSEKAVENMQQLTQELIDKTLKLEGTYYLPYQLYATDEQIREAYPRLDEFFALKKRIDPDELFTNHLYERYKNFNKQGIIS